MSYNKKMVLLASWIGLLLFGVTIISVGSFLPFLEVKYQLQSVDKGSLATALPAGILLGSLAFGPIVDRYSYKYLLTTCLVLIGIGLELTAFATDFRWVQLAFFLIGAGGGAINGAGSALVADISDDFNESKSANLSMLGVFFGLGTLGTPALLAALTGVINQDIFIAAIGVLAFVPAVFYLFITFPTSKHPQGLKMADWLKLVAQPAILLLGMVAFMQSALESMVNNWTTSYWTGTADISARQALTYLTLFTLSFTAGRFALGYVLRKVSSFATLLVSLVLAAAGGIALAAGTHVALVYAAVALLGFGLAAGFPVIFGEATGLFARMSGSALSIVLVIALTGNILANYIMGQLAQEFGIEKLPLMILGLIVMEAILLFPAMMAVRKKRTQN